MSDTDLLFDTSEIEIKKVEKKKRVLSQKQLDNLAKGRLKMKEKRDLKKLENEKKGLLKKEKVAVTKNVSIKKENKINKKNLKKIQQKEQAEKLSKFDDLKSKWLLKTETIEDYDLVKTELDTIPEDTILNDDKLELSLLDIMKKYKGDELEEDEQ